MRRQTRIGLAVGLVIGMAGLGAACEALGGGESAESDSAGAFHLAGSDDPLAMLDPTRMAAESRALMAARIAIDTGFRCGWHLGWTDAIRAGRLERPAAFRSRTMGAVFTLILVAGVIGLVGTIGLAWILPRSRRRASKAEASNPASPGTGEAAAQPSAIVGWARYFGDLFRRFLARLAHAMRVDQLDPSLVDQRVHALLACRQAERELALAAATVARLSPSASASPANHSAGAPAPDAATPDPNGPSAPNSPSAPSAPSTAASTTPSDPTPLQPPEALRAGMLEWQGELAALRRRIAATAPLPRELAPEVLVARLDLSQRRARDLRVALERHLATETTPTWNALAKELAMHPETPREAKPLAAHPLPTWVRPAGLGGMVALTLGLFMISAWTAAGAFPLFFALIFSLAGLGAVITARIHLHRAGRPLLPGFADRVGSWLTTLSAMALAVLIISSWMSAEGGLDMGDPPPVPVPDPLTLQAPQLWPVAKPGPTP